MGKGLPWAWTLEEGSVGHQDPKDVSSEVQ